MRAVPEEVRLYLKNQQLQRDEQPSRVTETSGAVLLPNAASALRVRGSLSRQPVRRGHRRVGVRAVELPQGKIPANLRELPGERPERCSTG